MRITACLQKEENKWHQQEKNISQTCSTLHQHFLCLLHPAQSGDQTYQGQQRCIYWMNSYQVDNQSAYDHRGCYDLLYHWWCIEPSTWKKPVLPMTTVLIPPRAVVSWNSGIITLSILWCSLCFAVTSIVPIQQCPTQSFGTHPHSLQFDRRWLDVTCMKLTVAKKREDHNAPLWSTCASP